MAEKEVQQPDLEMMVDRHETVKIDEKGRIPLHPEFRKALGSKVAIVGDNTVVLRLYPTEEFAKLARTARARFSDDNDDAKLYNKVRFSNKRDVELDGSFRIGIPTDLRKNLKLDPEGSSELVIIGSDRDFQIMTLDSYKQYLASPVKFMATEREEQDVLRFKAFQTEAQIRSLEQGLKGS
ncbi:MAG TPA: hypothetical protein VK171_06070 [Fimbriimonas sp.]|nr:hypothetical protein [Fimbriimonas sp.]